MYEIISTPPKPDSAVVDFSVDAQGTITLHRLERAGLTRVGQFRSAAEAWAALDAIDAPDAGRLAA